MLSKRMAKSVLLGCTVVVLLSCSMMDRNDTDAGTSPETDAGTSPETGDGTDPETGDGSDPETGDGTGPGTGRDDRPVCTSSEFLENAQYINESGRKGIPFPLLRHSFCTHQDRDLVRYSFELSDARKTVHAVFALEFSAFETTHDGAAAEAIYERSTFQAITDFAVGNALSKWLDCRDMIQSKEEFAVDLCKEVSSGIRHVGAGEPGGQPEDLFPCGINVGPDGVRDHDGDEVPASVYSDERKSLTGDAKKGVRLQLKTDSRIAGVYVPAMFFDDLTFATELPACGG